MFKDEADFEKIVGRLNINDAPDRTHRERLRRQMLSVFNETAEESSGGPPMIQAQGRSILRSPLVKFAAAAAILVVAALAVRQLTGPENDGMVVKGPGDETKINGSEAVHISTPTLVPIELELPRPMFIGTPQNTRVVNLERPRGRPRSPFLAPLGTRNVALGKSVAGSDDDPIIGELQMITDDDKEAADGSYVELGPSVQHITIDLEAPHYIYAVVVWHYHKLSRVYFDVIVQLADDPDFITNVRTLFNNDIDNSAGQGVGKDRHYTETNEGRLIDAKGLKARYVRLYTAGNTSNDLNHYIEVAVYGIPVE